MPDWTEIRDAVYRKLIAQAVLRGLDGETQKGLVVIKYPEPQDDRQDNLHKQSIRSRAKALLPEDWQVHIAGMGESGFMVEARPSAAALTLPPAQPVEVHEQVRPEPMVAGEEVDLTSPDRIASIAARLRELADEIEGAA